MPDKVYTPEEARRYGLKSLSPQKPDEICEFCGKTLHHEGLVLMGTVIWNHTAQRCDCQEAQRKWAEYDAERRDARVHGGNRTRICAGRAEAGYASYRSK